MEGTRVEEVVGKGTFDISVVGMMLSGFNVDADEEVVVCGHHVLLTIEGSVVGLIDSPTPQKF